MRVNDPNELADSYTAVWMEPDGDRRRKAIAELWSEDAIHVLQPTQEVYEAADERAVNPTWQVRGRHELEARVTSEVLGAGLEFVILAADGRIATDYQFVE